MNWDQIERKWDEMTRRVQPPSSLPSLIGSGPLQTGPVLPSEIDPAASSGLSETLIGGKTCE